VTLCQVTGLKKRPSTVQLELSYRGQPFHELEQLVRVSSSSYELSYRGQPFHELEQLVRNMSSLNSKS
jgi:hypothetical protein